MCVSSTFNRRVWQYSAACDQMWWNDFHSIVTDGLDCRACYLIACYSWLLNSLVLRLSSVDGKKRAWYTLFVHAQFGKEFGNFRKITLTSTKHDNLSCVKDACHWPCCVWIVTREQWRQSVLCLQEVSTCLSIPAKWLRHTTDAIFSFEVHRLSILVE